MDRAQKEAMVSAGLVCELLSGSHAYGTSLPTSDVDVRGIFIAPPVCVLTPFFTVEELKDENEEDTKFFELRNFFKLMTAQNPNILEMLWVDDTSILKTSPAYEKVRSVRHQLLSSRLAKTFCGYAHGQLLRIKGHNKWINNPQSVDAPKQQDFMSVVFNMSDNKEWNKKVPMIDMCGRDLGNNLFGLYYNPVGTSWFDKNGVPKPEDNSYWGNSTAVPNVIVKLNMDQYKAAHQNWKQYWDWKKNRNVKRSELEEKYGYDTKHAMHLVRLLRMGKEALTQGEVFVKRPDAKELLDIRFGAWKYEDLVKYAEDLKQEVLEAEQTTKLPKAVDVHFAGELLMELQNLAWSKYEGYPQSLLEARQDAS